MKDLGPVKEFLGIQVTTGRTNHILHISHAAYVDKILEQFNMHNSKPMNTPMELSSSRINDTGALSSDIPYRSAIGSLST